MKTEILYSNVFSTRIPQGTHRSLTVTFSSHYLLAFLFKEFPLLCQLELTSSQSTSQWKYQENLTKSRNHNWPSFSIAVSNMLSIIVILMMLVLNSELFQVFLLFFFFFACVSGNKKDFGGERTLKD